MFCFWRTILIEFFSWDNKVHVYVWINNTVYLIILNFIYVQRIMYTGAVCGMHGIINYTKAKCPHLKRFTCKGTLRQVFIDWRDTVSHVGIFDPALWTVAPLTFSLVHLSPSTPSLLWISLQNTRIQCVGGGMGFQEGRYLRQINTCHKVPFKNF